MFDNGKGRMIQMTDIYFLVRVGMQGNLMGLEDEQVNQDLERGGVRSGERR